MNDSQQDSTVDTEVIRVETSFRHLELWLVGPRGLRRLPLPKATLDFLLQVDHRSEIWRLELLPGGGVQFWSPTGQSSGPYLLNQEVEMPGLEMARVVDLRTLSGFSLVSLCKEERFRIWNLGPGVHRIGRPGKRANEIALTEPSCSRTHATISVGDQQAQLLTETGLSAINGHNLPAGDKATLRPGDLLQLGGSFFRWEVHLSSRAERIELSFFQLGQDRIELHGSPQAGNLEVTDKARNLLHWLFTTSPASLPVKAVFQEYWPGRTSLRQRKNLSHLLATLQAGTGLCDQAFQRLIHREIDHLRLNPEWVRSSDVETLRGAIRSDGFAPQESLLELYQGHFLPTRNESWVRARRNELLAEWLVRVHSSSIELRAQMLKIQALLQAGEVDEPLNRRLRESLRSLSQD